MHDDEGHVNTKGVRAHMQAHVTKEPKTTGWQVIDTCARPRMDARKPDGGGTPSQAAGARKMHLSAGKARMRLR